MTRFILITGCYVALAGVGVGIFLYGKADGNSIFDRLYRMICMWLPRMLKKLLEKCLGKRAPAALDWLWNYLCYTSNPLVQVFYLVIVVGGFIVFVSAGFPHIPSRLISGWHRYTGLAVFLTCITVWWKACSADPGTVTRLNVDRLCEMIPWDNQLFQKGICRTCNILKPARSKHCSLCGICVARFDHHCIWINNCVGQGNHKWFLSFLFMHFVLCIYAVFLGMMIVYEHVLEKDLFKAVFVDPVTKERHPATYMIILQYMLATEGMLIFICILAGVMGVVLCGFFMWHLNLVRMGTTTNEVSKWSYVKWILKKEGDAGKEKIKLLRNEYSYGCIENFREVFFNVDVHNLPARSDEPTKEKGGSKKVKKNQ